MTISNKLSYLNDTKTLLRESINQAGGSITEETPFREYPSWVNYVVWLSSGGLETLFSEGEEGVLWSNLPYFVDVDGNTPATWGDPVGLIKDSSGNGNDFTQPTVTARPILGRVPRGGRRNTVSNSTLLGAGYAFSNVTGILDGTGPRGDAVRCESVNPEAYGYLSYTQDVDKAWIPGDLYRTSIAIKNIDATQTRVRFRATSYHVIIDWSDPLASGITPIDGWPDWYLMEITGPAEDPNVVNNNRRVLIYPQNDKVSSGSILVSGLQVEVGEETTPYQLVNNEYDITEEGVPDVYCLNFDLTDDNLTTTLPAIESGTVVIAGTNGIWIDDDYNFDGGTFSIGPTTYTGGPEGILEVIGDPIVGGFLVIDRQLTTAERARVVAHMQSIGSPGVIELGPELLVNSDFSDGFDGWTLAGSEPERWSVSDGVATIAVGTSPAYLRQDNVTADGLPHLITVDIVSSNGVGDLYAGGGTDNIHLFPLAGHPVGEMSAVYVSGAFQPNRAQVYAAPKTQASISSISFREVILP